MEYQLFELHDLPYSDCANFDIPGGHQLFIEPCSRDDDDRMSELSKISIHWNYADDWVTLAIKRLTEANSVIAYEQIKHLLGAGE